MEKNDVCAGFWESWEPLSTDRYTESQLLAARRSNERGEQLFLRRTENLPPWLIFSFRWRLLKQLPQEFSDAAGIAHASLSNLEDPTTDFHSLRPHTALSRVVQYWERRIAQIGAEDEQRDTMKQGLSSLFSAVTRHTRLKTHALFIRERLRYGTENFDAAVQFKNHTFTKRIATDVPIPLIDLLLIPQEKSKSSSGEAAEAARWRDVHVQNIITAARADAVTAGMQSGHALLMLALQFLGMDLTKLHLKRMGVSQTARDLMLQGKKVHIEKVQTVLNILQERLGTALYDELVSRITVSAEESDSGVGEVHSFAKQIRSRLQEYRLEHDLILHALSYHPTDQKSDSVMRTALERGPNTRLPVAALLYLTVPQEDIGTQLRLANGDIEGMKFANTKRVNVPLRAALTLWGCSIEDLDLSTDEAAAFARTYAGDPDGMSQKEALQRIQRAGLNKNVVPALQRFNASLEPRNLASALNIVGQYREGGLAQMAIDASTSYETIVKFIEGDASIPFKTIHDLFAAVGTPLPASAAVDYLLRSAQLARKLGHPLGVAFMQMISATARFPKQWFREHANENFNERQLYVAVKNALAGKEISNEIYEELIQELRVNCKSGMMEYFSVLRNEGNVPRAILAWIRSFHNTNAADRIGALEAFLQYGPTRQHIGPTNVHTLLNRRDVLLRWRSSTLRPNDVLDTEQDGAALSVLKELPGATRDDILEALRLYRVEPVQTHDDESEVAVSAVAKPGRPVVPSRPTYVLQESSTDLDIVADSIIDDALDRSFPKNNYPPWTKNQRKFFKECLLLTLRGADDEEWDEDEMTEEQVKGWRRRQAGAEMRKLIATFLSQNGVPAASIVCDDHDDD